MLLRRLLEPPEEDAVELCAEVDGVGVDIGAAVVDVGAAVVAAGLDVADEVLVDEVEPTMISD